MKLNLQYTKYVPQNVIHSASEKVIFILHLQYCDNQENECGFLRRIHILQRKIFCVSELASYDLMWILCPAQGYRLIEKNAVWVRIVDEAFTSAEIQQSSEWH